MAIDDIKNYIEQNQDKHPVDVLLNQLRASGYPESEIQAYLSGKDGAPLPAQAQTQIQPQLSFLGKIGKWLLGLVLGAIIVGVAFGAAVYFVFASYSGEMAINPIFIIAGVFIAAGAILFFIYWRYRKRSPYIARGFLAALIVFILLAAFILYLASMFLGLADINPLVDARTKSRDARRVADLKQIQLALELYYDANAKYPDSLDVLTPNYIYEVPFDPIKSSPYFYEKRADGSYWLKAYLEDSNSSYLANDNNPGDQFFDVSESPLAAPQQNSNQNQGKLNY